MNAATSQTVECEVSILARFLGNHDGQLPEDFARYILSIEVSDRDKARMHDLAVRNQEDTPTPAEKEEMHASAKATSLLSIMKSKARRTLGVSPRHGSEPRLDCLRSRGYS
jgi:hypothetical protein